MKLKVSQDAGLPVERAFAGLLDLDHAEEELAAHGVELVRSGRWLEPHVGAAWSGRAEIRGRVRRLSAEITALEPGRSMAIDARIGGMQAHYEILLVPLGQDVTRVNVVLDLRPATLSARLVLQSLKLGRGRLLRRMQARLAREILRAGSSQAAG